MKKQLTEVEDPSKYGVVLYESNGMIKKFVEKPKEYIGNKINAGLYIFNTKMIKRIPVSKDFKNKFKFFRLNLQVLKEKFFLKWPKKGNFLQ